MPITYDISKGFPGKKRTVSIINRGIREGREEGLQKGLQEGIERRGVEIALNLIGEGFDTSTISKVTGLTISQIDALRKG